MLKTQKHIVFFVFFILFFANISFAENKNGSKEYLFAKANNLYNKDDLYNSISIYNQLLTTFNKKSNDYVTTLVGLGKCYAALRKYDIALNYFNTAEKIALKNSNNSEILKEILLRKGNISVVSGNATEAISILNKLLNLKKTEIITKDKSLIPIYEDLGSAYILNSNFEKATYYFNLEVAISTKHNDFNSTFSAYNNIAKSFASKGDYNNALVYYNKSQDLVSRYKSIPNSSVIDLYIAKAQLNSNIKEYSTAITLYNEAEKIYTKDKITDISKISFLYTNKAINFYFMGDYEKALSYYEKTLSLYLTDKKNIYQVQINSLYHNIGNTYLEKKEYNTAIAYYTKCITYNSKNNKVDLATNYNSIAIAYKRSGQLNLASQNYKLAIKNRLNNSGSKSVEIAKDYLNYGELLMTLNNKSAALEMLFKSLTTFKNFHTQKHPDISSCLTSIGNYYLKYNNPEKALNYYQDAIIAVVSDFNNKVISSNPTQIKHPNIEVLNALKCKAFALNILSSKKKNAIELLKNSYNTYNLAVSIISRMHNSYSNDESKLFIAENEKQTYTNALEVAEKLFKLTGDVNYISLAWQFAEKSKASVVLSNLRDGNALNYGNIPTFLKESEQNIKNNISSTEKELHFALSATNPDQSKINNLKNKLFDLEKQKENLIYQLESKYKDYYNLKYNDKVIDVKTVQANLKDKESVIEIVLSNKTIYTFLIRNNFYNLYSQSIDSELKNNIELVRKFTSTNTFGNGTVNEIKAYTDASYSIYQKILQPLENNIRWNHLIIIPDEQLNLISFETLLNRPVKNASFDFSKLPYLILEHPISYSYSSTLLYNTYGNSISAAKNNVLAFAPDYKNINKNNLYASANYRNELTNLKNTKEETTKISTLMNGKVLQDNMATKNNFLSMAKDYNILHLAMHAVINDDNPMYSKLVFTQDQKNSEDAMLNTSDIYNMQLNSKMVVLSACNTGNGQLRKGEGIMSLARAFFYAGCPSVVMTLWSVEDKASSDLMYGFYKYISQGYSKDKAMQLAKIDYIQNNPPSKTHPFYWAGYVSIGDDSPLYTEKAGGISTAYLLLFAGIGLGISTPFFTNRRLNRKLKRKYRMLKYYFVH